MGDLLGPCLASIFDRLPELGSGLVEGFAGFRDGLPEVFAHAHEAPLDPLYVSMGQFGT